MFVSFGFSQLGAVRLQQLETELAEDLQEGHVRVLLLSLLWLPKCKTYTVPWSKQQTHNSFDKKNKSISQVDKNT